ncbi:hypothetical protein GCM10025864_20120 [Luteimicrobium album]|uniref:Uncharacterized protein n=1 Tax=Luteimicrobium album TaxID=1054550 RepID=A0ABQ6I0I4_9MICO|nr:hypothetical protein GCM10025864_20120 [Luteimicrobium album]
MRLLPIGRCLLAALLLTAGVLLAACDALDPDPEPSCTPGPLEVSPGTVAPGGQVTVRSGKVSCTIDRGYTHYELHLRSMEDDAVVGTVEVGTHGEFATTVTIPADAHAGDASLVVSGSTYDYCPQHAGPAADCAAYHGDVVVDAG